jgi:hypothetical protein
MSMFGGLQQPTDRVGGDLTIGGHEGDPGRRSSPHTCFERGSDTSIGGVPEYLGVRSGQRALCFELRSIRRAVVYEQDLGLREVLVEPTPQLADDRGYVLCFVVCKDDQTQRRCHGRTRKTRAGTPATTA